MRGQAIGSIALAYASRGLRVLPLHSAVDGRCTCAKRAACGSAGKHPIASLVPHGVTDATDDVATVRAWWTKYPSANVGIACGVGLWAETFVVDIDPRHGGDEALAALESEHGPLPLTLTARTGSGGRHLLFALEDLPAVEVERLYAKEAKARQRAGRGADGSGGRGRAKNLPANLPEGFASAREARAQAAAALNVSPRLRGRIANGVDIKGRGGYVVAAPSIHASGRRYAWQSPKGTPIAPAPAWLAELVIVREREPEIDTPAIRWVDRSDVVDRARKYLSACDPAISGSGGHRTTFVVAMKLVRGFGLSPEVAYSLMSTGWNHRCSPPWSPAELWRKVVQAAKRGEMREGALRDAEKGAA